MSRIIKASESQSEPVCSFDFSEILETTWCDPQEREVLDSASTGETDPDPLLNLESMVQQRLLQAERRAQELEQEGYEKGYAQGLKDGTEFGRKSMQVAREQFEELLARMIKLPDTVFEDYRNWFINTSLAVSKHIVRAELHANPRVLIDLMEDVLSEAGESQGITLFLHPKDLELLSRNSALDEMVAEAEKAFTIRTDPQMSRGGCRLESDIQLIDASLENRLGLIEKTLLETEEAEENDSGFTDA